MDIQGTPLARLVVIITLEDALLDDWELLTIGNIVALGVDELEVLSVVEPVRILIACVVPCQCL